MTWVSSWLKWEVWCWCPLTGTTPDVPDFGDDARIVAMIDQLREDFFGVLSGTVPAADNADDANHLEPPTSPQVIEARAIWLKQDQVVAGALAPWSNRPREYPGIGDAWHELPADHNMLDDLCTGAHRAAVGWSGDPSECADRWPAERVLALLAIGELASVLRCRLSGLSEGIEIGPNGKRYGVEFSNAIGVTQVAYEVRASSDPDRLAGLAMRDRARKVTRERADVREQERIEVTAQGRMLVQQRHFDSLRACAIEVARCRRLDAEDANELRRIVGLLSTDAEVVARCKSKRGRPPKAG